MITTGDKVRHPKMPDWGLGKVMEVTSDGKARIFFISGSRRVREIFRWGRENAGPKVAPKRKRG